MMDKQEAQDLLRQTLSKIIDAGFVACVENPRLLYEFDIYLTPEMMDDNEIFIEHEETTEVEEENEAA